MRVTSKSIHGQAVHQIGIRTDEPGIYIRLASIFLTPNLLFQHRPAPNPLTGVYEFSADDAQFMEFARHMEIEKKDWLLFAADEQGVNDFGQHVEEPLPVNLGDDPTDRGVKTPVLRLNHAAFVRLFESIVDNTREELRAAASLSPASDIKRGDAS
jgi:hypothetical protein